FHRQGPPAQSRPGTARHKRNPLAMANTHDPLDLFHGARQQHSLRNDAEIRQPVTLVGLQFFLRCDQAAVPSDGAELLENAGFHEDSVWPAASPEAGTPGTRVVPQYTNVKPCGMNCAMT